MEHDGAFRAKSAPAGAKGAIALLEPGGRWEHPLLKELVVEASQALARLDAERLEELALSCQALNRDLEQHAISGQDGDGSAALARDAREAVGDMAVFARVLEATRANLNVMNHLRELREGRLEYREGPVAYSESQAQQWRRMESGHGNN
jgi:hypothetical protein